MAGGLQQVVQSEIPSALPRMFLIGIAGMQGMALLCQSRPVGDVTIETQSDWGYSLGMAEWKGATGVISGKKPESLTPWEK